MEQAIMYIMKEETEIMCEIDDESRAFFGGLTETESYIGRFGAKLVLHYLSEDLGEEFNSAVIEHALGPCQTRHGLIQLAVDRGHEVRDNVHNERRNHIPGDA